MLDIFMPVFRKAKHGLFLCVFRYIIQNIIINNMETLGLLFGTPARVKIMRLFLFNAGRFYDLKDVCEKSKVTISIVKRELTLLEKARLINHKEYVKNTEKEQDGKKIEVKKKAKGWILNDDFVYISALRTFLLTTRNLEHTRILQKLSSSGKLKLVILAGVFINDPESRVDVLVVGDKLSKGSLANAIKNLESEIGKELNYAFFETDDFKYRIGVYDKLVRDILDYPHKVLLDKLAVKNNVSL